jgi:hypothetical protein
MLSRRTHTLVLGLSLATHCAPALAGPLDPPPGPVAPTMKPLDQVEPRIPIDRLPYTISISGSYYLTESLVGVAGEVGILVRARRVTIDLNGFELRGAAGTLDAIQVIEGITPCADLVVRNGAIFGWERVGINASCVSGSVFENLRIEGNAGFAILAADFAVARNVRALDNGTGIEFGVGAFVDKVFAADNRDDGIGVDARSVVVNSSAINNQGIGVRAGPRSVVENVTASGNTAVGVRLEAGSTGTRITAEENANIGIALNGKGVLVDSVAANNTPTGILAFAGSRIERCAVSDNATNGIVLNGPGVLKDNTLVDNPTQILLNNDGSRVEGNDLSGGTTGVKGAGTGNLVVRNLVRGAKTPFDLAPGNLLGPVSTTMTDHPWANFTDK